MTPPLLEARNLRKTFAAPAGPLGDGQPHAITLAGVPCLPSGGPLVDPFADIPGPSMSSTPGTVRLMNAP